MFVGAEVPVKSVLPAQKVRQGGKVGLQIVSQEGRALPEVELPRRSADDEERAIALHEEEGEDDFDEHAEYPDEERGSHSFRNRG